MGQRRLPLICSAGIACITCCVNSFADSPCSGVALTEVLSLTQLSPTLRAVLPKATEGLDGIADRGMRFNTGDALVGNLPRQRFGIAAVGASCAVIAVEHGGIAFHTIITEYHLTVAGWRAAGFSTTGASPNSKQGLLRLFELSPRCPQTPAVGGRTCIN